MLQAQLRAKLRKRKAKFKPTLFAPARDATESYTNERRKFKPHSTTSRTARNNKLTMPKRSVDAYAACDTKAQHTILNCAAALNLKSR